ncbi:MAG: hypothetical protein CEE42_14020 [Promethearchaeota archaeon Loki_b31]|nr:MAG: hypothetical protein CEE42_14020 [Candidatus Lokiarchaeota archaeon Loki_b31]
MKKLSKILLGTIFLMILFSTITSFNVVVVGDPDDDPIGVNTDTYHAHIQANTMTMFRFRNRTQLRLNANVNLEVDFDCEALKIGAKDFALEIEGSGDLQMSMTCTEEQKELGLLKGNTYQIRNRNRVQYQEGFVVKLECNGTFTRARLSIRVTNENRIGQWAYYDEATEEWVSVPTTIKGDYLTAEVSHFSTWTILIPDYTILIIGLSIGGVVALIIIGSVIYVKKKKSSKK